MSLNQLHNLNDGHTERNGIPASSVESLLKNDSAGVTSRGLKKAEKTVFEAIAEFDKASKCLFSASERLNDQSDKASRRAKELVSKAKDQANQLADALNRVNKILGPEFDVRLQQMERMTKALESLAELHRSGLLPDMLKAISK